MKAVVLAENLQKKLSFTTHAVSSRIQLPILSNVLIEAKEGSLVISATDLEIGIEAHIPATIEEEGATTVPARLFLEFVTNLPQDKVSLQTVEEGLEISSKRTRAVLQTTTKEEFPTLFENKGTKVFSMEPGMFKEAFEKIVFAASIETTRPALSGVLVKRTQEGVILVATDGYRLSCDVISTETPLAQGAKLLIPAKIIREALSLGGQGEVTLYVYEESHQVIFEQNDVILVGRLIEADFPNYEKILPTDFATQARFDRENMLKAVKTTTIFAREVANVMRLAINKEKIIVSAKTPSLGENTAEVEAQVKGEENEIAFNGKYLLEVLSHLSENELVFEMTGPLNSGIFKSPKFPHFLHLIMPVRQG